jgi:hypothetical protein
LDDGIPDFDEENDTIIYQREKSKILYMTPPPINQETLARTIYAKVDLDTTSFLCPNTQMLFSPDSKESLLMTGVATAQPSIPLSK